MVPSSARLTLRLRPGFGFPRYETMWAERVRPGRFLLRNSSFFAPLAVGDAVEAVERDGRLLVTDAVEAGPMALSITVVDRSLGAAETKSAADVWLHRGASWTEGGFGILATVWKPGITADDVFELLLDDLRDRPGWHTPIVYAPDDRTRDAIAEVARLG